MKYFLLRIFLKFDNFFNLYRNVQEAPNNSISSVSRSIFTAVKNAKADGETTKIGKAKALLKVGSVTHLEIRKFYVHFCRF